MADKEIIEVSPRHINRINRLNMDKERLAEFGKLIERACEAKPDKKDLQDLRQFLIDYPELCRIVYSLADEARELLIRKIIDNKMVEIALEEYTVKLRDDLGYHEAPVMEQLLIENIILAWLRVYWLEYQITLQMGRDISIRVTEFWERRLSMAQKRYLAACETLAKIRKMAIPAFQLNIGDKQINVAGNLKPGSKA